MIGIKAVRQLALSFPETDEDPHPIAIGFERRAFRVKKKIFATLSEKDITVNLKLSLYDQSVFCAFDKSVIYPVPGGWGRMGFTFVNLKKVKKTMFIDALTVAYCNIAPPKLAAAFLPR
ncbi:MAG: MmcQ/YjbR family DNA-binding protein [Chitinophagaceae bacterium]|nr:MmcQ/YjbR family DNA-binding protein [Chitinophagaceae bacterium]